MLKIPLINRDIYNKYKITNEQYLLAVTLIRLKSNCDGITVDTLMRLRRRANFK